jgi:hypothetical protein
MVRFLREKSSERGLSVDGYTAELLAKDELTPDQRRMIDARLAEGLDDLKYLRSAGPFLTHVDLMTHLTGKRRKT